MIVPTPKPEFRKPKKGSQKKKKKVENIINYRICTKKFCLFSAFANPEESFQQQTEKLTDYPTFNEQPSNHKLIKIRPFHGKKHKSLQQLMPTQLAIK